jgi:hypothetical protein
MSVSKETVAWYLQKRRRQRAEEDYDVEYNWTGTWDPAGVYAVGDGVTVGTDADPYVCTVAVGPSAVTPDSDAAHWSELQPGPTPPPP